jgi:hypothetical protein
MRSTSKNKVSMLGTRGVVEDSDALRHSTSANKDGRIREASPAQAFDLRQPRATPMSSNQFQ